MKFSARVITTLSSTLILVILSGCNKDSVTEPVKDTEKPTVSILFPAAGADVKADTTYTVIADANDNIKVTKVEFYISGQNSATDTLSPFEYRWNTQGLTGSQTIMAKAYDESGNIGTSGVISVTIKGAANHAPVAPSNPFPANGATGQSFYLTLSWFCSDPDGDALTYDVYFGTTNPPTSTVASSQSTRNISRIGLSDSTTHYWKIVAKDNKGASTSGPVWSFTTASTIKNVLIQISGGTFQMGSNDATDQYASPRHSVTLGAFYIDKYEITYEQWTDVRNWGLTHGYTDLVAGRNGYNGTTNHPVTEVSWYDILKWCNARSEKDGLTPVYYTSNTLSTVYRTGQLNLAADAVKWTANGYRLPTEAEWEFAARGGTKSQGYTYSGSNNIDSVGWYSNNSGTNTHPVSTKAANELGIYDMSGNVEEWCWDWYGAYSSTTQTDPKGPTSGSYRVLRGGSFDAGGVLGCRVDYRNAVYPTVRNVGYVGGYGFRCVQD